MASSRKVIITCAVTGSIHTPSMSPYLPVTAARGLGLAIATPAEARAMLQLKGRNEVGFYEGTTC